jgi:pimeloyl-ACP methyl ester carboxylesterase
MQSIPLQTVRLAGRCIEYALARPAADGHSGPPIVFENGLMGRLNEWQAVWHDLPGTTRFAYHRPGYGRSAQPLTARDGLHIVDELRALLATCGLNPPYLLVGHSLGGLYMHLFARRYPAEVSGLVLVDPTHPQQFQGNGAPAHWPWWLRIGFQLMLNRTARAEFTASGCTGEQLLALPAHPGCPTQLLSASGPQQDSSLMGIDGAAKRRDMLRLLPGAQQHWIDCGHHIHRECPAAVSAAIRNLSLPQAAASTP